MITPFGPKGVATKSRGDVPSEPKAIPSSRYARVRFAPPFLRKGEDNRFQLSERDRLISP